TGNIQLKDALTEQRKKPNFFVLVLVYLELPDFINQYLLSLSNFKIKNGDKEDMAYQYLLNHFQGQSVAAAKQFLTKRGISIK
ncbi:hypothetical protein ACLSYH_08685, partial [Streptococcus pluranimalium]